MSYVNEMLYTSLCHITKEKNLSKIPTKTATWKLVPDSSVFAKNLASIYWKMDFLKQAVYIKYVIAKLSKLVQISLQTY